MSVISEKVKRDLDDILRGFRMHKYDPTLAEHLQSQDALEKILAIPEIAIVDRNAELPFVSMDSQLPAVREAVKLMLKDGWVKEVKDV